MRIFEQMIDSQLSQRRRRPCHLREEINRINSLPASSRA
jgi:hypothetical protein